MTNNMTPQEFNAYINDPKNYRPARKKQYQIWCCMPPVGTHVRNFLEAIDYMTSQDARFVLSGTRGEQWVIRVDKLAATYTFADGTPITQETLRQRLNKDGTLDWFKVQTRTNAAQVWACHVPVRYTFPFQTSWGAMMCNRAGIPHGLGDFIIRSNAGNVPGADGYICNGAVFADTYDNRGWADCIRVNQSAPVLERPKPLFKSDVASASSHETVLTELCNMLESCKRMAAKEMPFNYKREGDTITVIPTVISDYRKKAEQGTDGAVERFSHCKTVISLKDGKIWFRGYNVYDNTQTKTHQYSIPETPEGLKTITSAPQLYAGLMGWVPNGMHNYFTYTQTPTKYMQNGIIEYTMFSGGVNRKCRLQDYDDPDPEKGHKRAYERVGQESQRLYRVIDGCDAFLDSVYLNKSILLFRGMPAKGTLERLGISNVNELPGKTIINTAYTSSTLNMHSTMLFSKTREDPNNGIILAIDIPQGTKCALVHDIAARGEQFEVLWQRCYDIRVGDKLMEFDGGNNFKYHVFRASIVAHVPNGPVPLDTSRHSNVVGIDRYDENGRIRFDYEMIRGYMREAFDNLKKRGLEYNIQIQPAFANDPREYIVARAGLGDDDYIVDLAFSYNSRTHLLDVFKFKSRKDMLDKVSVRNYWGRSHDEGAPDHDMTWEDYKANELWDLDKDAFICEPKSSIALKVNSKAITNSGDIDTSKLGDVIADTIIEYVKYNKDVTLLPLQDVARYFDTVFKNTVISEGYWLKDSIPVVRVGDPEKPESGYVPMKYHIDGDNDDSLVISMKLARDENGKLQLVYRGQSQNNKVNEQKQLRWNIFNHDIMERTCKQIMYTFVSKLNLNHVRKGDMLMSCVARYKHYALTGTRYSESDDPQLMTVQDKSSQRIYKLYFSQTPNDYAKIRITTEQRVMKIDIATKNGTKSGQLDATLPIFELYKQVVPIFEQLRGGNVA